MFVQFKYKLVDYCCNRIQRLFDKHISELMY